ncbi:white collar 2 type of transcription factor [Madurella fahalii]|uniref:White collar 2 type of transcription factor n=1 Tax=Madurella fahalii TaxID=1157608 RepID=A0ABQ0FWY2_9PEZI
MSHGHPLPDGLLGFGMPVSLGPGMPSLQMNVDTSNSMSLLDDSAFTAFDDAMAMSLDPSDPLRQSFVPEPVQRPNAAPVGATNQPSFHNHSMSNVPGGRSLPRSTQGSGNPSNATSMTEFTKRRNWPAKVVEELQDSLHVLDANGRIKHVSPSAKRLTGYQPSELRGLFLRDLLHRDDVGAFTSELNESIASGTPLRVFYRFKKKDGTYAVFEAVGHAHIAAPKFAPNPSNQSPFCQAVFLTVRPYPTKNAALLDSFLEHKMENERLKRKIAELQGEEQDEPQDSTTGLEAYPLGKQDPSNPLRDRRMSLDNGHPEGVSGARHLPMGATDTIEMLTGRRYQDGERNRGPTTHTSSPTLVKGDVGIAIPVDRDSRAGEKKKKLKVAEEYVCTDCGTLESPEWRKGPSGPKTLCNACGLRWAKREKRKKRGSSGGSGGGAPEHHLPAAAPAD